MREGWRGLFHERIVLSYIRSAEYVILLPDLYMHEEDLLSGDFTSIRLFSAGLSLPPDITPSNTYSFVEHLSPADVFNYNRWCNNFATAIFTLSITISGDNIILCSDYVRQGKVIFLLDDGRLCASIDNSIGIILVLVGVDIILGLVTLVFQHQSLRLLPLQDHRERL